MPNRLINRKAKCRRRPIQLSRTFAALADPTRRAMLARLSKGEATVTWSSRPPRLELSLPAIEAPEAPQRAGSLSSAGQAQWRPCTLKPERLRDDVADRVGQYRRLARKSFE